MAASQTELRLLVLAPHSFTRYSAIERMLWYVAQCSGVAPCWVGGWVGEGEGREEAAPCQHRTLRSRSYRGAAVDVGALGDQELDNRKIVCHMQRGLAELCVWGRRRGGGSLNGLALGWLACSASPLSHLVGGLDAGTFGNQKINDAKVFRQVQRRLTKLLVSGGEGGGYSG